MKTTLSITHLTQSAVFAITAAIVAVSMVFATFLVAEPQITRGQVDTADFYIRQTIVDETSFEVPPADVLMNGSINGVSGGNATGTTQFVVISNNASGYFVNMRFEDNPGDHAMYGDIDQDDSIRDYEDDAGEPSFGFTASTAAQFAYTVAASSSQDIDRSFKHDGSSTCDSVVNDTTEDLCWKGPSTADFRIIDRGSSAITGATSTIKFRINVPNGADPTPTAQTYTATATLTLFINS